MLPRRDYKGFTLIELMISMLIMGVLATAAIGVFGGYKIKVNRQDAVELLETASLRLERCFTLEGVYNGACILPTQSREGLYVLDANRAARSYLLKAVPVSSRSQASDTDCKALVLSHLEVRSATGELGHRCW